MHPSTFRYLKPSPDQLATMEQTRSGFEEIAKVVEANVPEGRYKALTLTKIEEAAMFANKGITRASDGTPLDGAVVESS